VARLLEADAVGAERLDRADQLEVDILERQLAVVHVDRIAAGFLAELQRTSIVERLDERGQVDGVEADAGRRLVPAKATQQVGTLGQRGPDIDACGRAGRAAGLAAGWVDADD